METTNGHPDHKAREICAFYSISKYKQTCAMGKKTKSGLTNEQWGHSLRRSTTKRDVENELNEF